MNANDAKRQLNEEHALDEMDISENGPNLPNADKILLSAMNKYWQSNKLIIGNGKIYRHSYFFQSSNRQAGVRTDAFCLHAVLYDAGITTDMGSVSMPCYISSTTHPRRSQDRHSPCQQV